MQCDNAKELLVSYLYDDEISQQERKLLNEHLEVCAICRRQFADLKSVRNLLGEWEDEEVRDQFIFVRPEAKVGFLGKWLPRWTTAFARASFAAAVFLLIGLLILAAANTEIIWEQGKLSFRASLFGRTHQQAADSSRRLSDEELLQIVDRMIAQSEMRVNRHYTDSLLDVVDRLEARRQAELEGFKTGMALLYSKYDETQRLINARAQNQN